MLHISKYAIENKVYNNIGSKTTWEKCSLRVWLNNEFITKAFNGDEQSKIAVTTLVDNSGKKPTQTENRVFVLSEVEARLYFRDENRSCKGTGYVFRSKAYHSDDGGCYWWLRGMGSSDYAPIVLIDGSIGSVGNEVIDERAAVRPAMWIDLKGVDPSQIPEIKETQIVNEK